MKIAILGIHPTPEKKLIIRAARRRGHECRDIFISDIVFDLEKNKIFCEKDKSILNFDVFLFRGLGKYFREFVMLAGHLISKNKVIVDEKLGTQLYTTSKLLTALKCRERNLPYPKSFEVFSLKQTKRIIRKMKKPFIIKYTISSKGEKVFKLNSFKQASSLLRKEDRFPEILIQEYLPAKEDNRVFVIGYKALGVMKRIVPKGDFRANIALGAKGIPRKLTPKIKRLAEKAAKITQTEIAGVDIIYSRGKPYILEVNRSPQFMGFIKTTEINVPDKIIDYLEKRYEKSKKKK